MVSETPPSTAQVYEQQYAAPDAVEPSSAMDKGGEDGEMAKPMRLHLRSILIWVLTRQPWDLLVFSAAFGGISRRISGSDGSIIPFAIAGVVVVILFFLTRAYLRWYRFTYTILPGELLVEEGIIARNRRSIPLERVQDVGIEQNPLARILGLATVKVESGGGETDEVVLESVSLTEAHRLRAILRSGARSGVAAAPDAGGDLDAPSAATNPADDAQLVPIFQMSGRRVILSGVFNFSLLWIGIIVAILQYTGNAIGFGMEELIDWIVDSQDQILDRSRAPIWALGVAGAVAVGCLGLFSGVAQAVLRDWGFTLYAGMGRFRRVRGLLTRTEVAVAIRRVQLALIERGPVRRFFGWQSLSLQTLGGSNDAGGRQALAPFARSDEVAGILAHTALPEFMPSALTPVAKAHALRTAMQGVAVPIGVMAASYWYGPLLYLGIALLLGQFVLAALAQRYHRYGVYADSLQVAHGMVAQKDWVVPANNIQSVTLVQGPFQRLLNTVTVRVDTAGAKGATPDVQDITPDAAQVLARDLVERIAGAR